MVRHNFCRNSPEQNISRGSNSDFTSDTSTADSNLYIHNSADIQLCSNCFKEKYRNEVASTSTYQSCDSEDFVWLSRKIFSSIEHNNFYVPEIAPDLTTELYIRNDTQMTPPEQRREQWKTRRRLKSPNIPHSSSNWSRDELSNIPLGSNTTYISQVLNRLTDRSRYDKRLRPKYGEGPVDVGITIHVSSISAVSEVDMDFTLDFYLRQTWFDPRLAFEKVDLGFERVKSLTVGVDYLDRLWKPDTFFPNEKKSFFHAATTHNSFLRIEPDGRVFTSQRLTVTATCPMELQLFPMDFQTCRLEIESYGYTTEDIAMYWGERRDDNKPAQKAVAFSEFALPQFRRTGFRVNSTKAILSSGEYVRLYFEVILTRNLGFYLMNIIIPSMLIVSISWVSFWLSREASPARVGLGVTTVLTMTTLITTTNNSMPKVSYIKGLDVFLNFCFVMVFASLVEFAVVSYWNKRQSRMRERRRRRGEAAQQPPEIPMFTNYPTTSAGGLAVSPSTPNYVYRPPGILVPLASTPTFKMAQSGGTNAIGSTAEMPPPMMPPDCDCRTIPLMQYNEGAVYHQQPIPYMNVSVRRGKRWRIGGGSSDGTGWCCRRFSPSKIDRCSRSGFPLLFIGFNCLYWSIMSILSSWTTNQQEFVPFT
ncbi:neurotransmitter-gated ion-channel ligand binding domain-containing protein [Ditylenchus destructor]|nr:neurotransmitter-gated ion-channel ligand binding domain-containing protein [Ditylenchus destructor]